MKPGAVQSIREHPFKAAAPYRIAFSARSYPSRIRLFYCPHSHRSVSYGDSLESIKLPTQREGDL